jgi:2-keto-4-pentenoate hydratase/2-oxohepta-3-ene-1,7-dioic acid hydratase in catechol pathway
VDLWGKALRTFAPLGLVVLDAAALPPVAEMTMRKLVNGELRQDGTGPQMTTGAPEHIAHISAGIVLGARRHHRNRHSSQRWREHESAGVPGQETR